MSSLQGRNCLGRLEARLPPPLVALLCAGVMWYVAAGSPSSTVPTLLVLIVAVGLGVVGAAVILAGIASFRVASTTVDPLNPETATTLVTGGVFRYTRNPMYLGVLLVLVGWAVYLSSPLPFVGPIAYLLYIQRFQIRPEERAMAALFGDAYAEYTDRVRRWL